VRDNRPVDASGISALAVASDKVAMDVPGAITLALAILGAGLGVFNTYIAWRKERARLRVVVGVAKINGKSFRLFVSITNLSGFPVTIGMVGLVLRVKGTGNLLGFQPEFSDALLRMPVTLAPRATVAAYLPAGTEQHSAFGLVRAVRVETQCGHRKQATSKGLRWFVKHRPAAADPHELQKLAGVWGEVVASKHGPPKSDLYRPTPGA